MKDSTERKAVLLDRKKQLEEDTARVASKLNAVTQELANLEAADKAATPAAKKA